MKAHGVVGALIIIGAEASLFLQVEPIPTWFTPLVWTGYILVVDALVYRRAQRSLLVTRRHELLWLLPLSIGFWVIFEGYNLLLKNWYYVNLPPSPPLRYLGYAWSFATILPALLETAEFLQGMPLFREARWRPLRIGPGRLRLSISTGLSLLLIPLLYPSPHLFGLVWVGFLFLLDPFSHRRGGVSFFRELEGGRLGLPLSWFVGGSLCGLLWEFWNYWAAAKWHYTVPITAEWKIFEMPIAGYFGFGPFALECGAVYYLARTFSGHGREEGMDRMNRWWRVFLCFLGVVLLVGPWPLYAQTPSQEEGQREKLLGIFEQQRHRRKEELLKHLAKHPQDLKAHFELGQLYALDGRIPEAIQEYQKVIEIDPHHETAHFNLGLLYHRAGRWDDAIEAFRQVLRLNPRDLPTHINLGVAYRDKRGETLKKEIEILEEAVRLRPDYPEAHYHLGIAYRAMGDGETACRPWYEKARYEFQRYIAGNPTGKRREEANRWIELFEERLKGC